MRLTQKQRVLNYIKENGSLTPAIEGDAKYKGKLLGSAADVRCRELYREGKLLKEQVGRFEKFYLKPEKKLAWVFSEDGTASMQEEENNWCCGEPPDDYGFCPICKEGIN